MKDISHFERLHDPKYWKVEVSHAPTTEKKLVRSTSLENGINVTRTEIKSVPIADRNKGLRFTDFSIDSLQASGAIADLSFCSLSESPMNVADKVDNIDAGAMVVDMSLPENNDLNNE